MFVLCGFSIAIIKMNQEDYKYVSRCKYVHYAKFSVSFLL